MTPSPPEGAPNVLLVLIDDAGFGNPSTFGGPVSTPTMTRVAEQGLSYNRFHVTALCSPTRAALLTGRNHHTRRLRLDRRAARPVPRLHGERAEGLRVVRPRAPGQRLLDRRVRQVAPDARPRAGRGRAVRPLAERVGLRPLLGLPRRRGGPVRPGDHAGQHDHRRPGGRGRQAVLPAGRPDRPGGALAARGARAGPGEAVVHLLLDRLRARAAPGRGRVEREVPRQVRPGLGQAARGDVRAAEAARRDPAGRGADAAAGRAPGLGLALGRARRSSTRGRWRSTPASRRTPTGTSAACSTRSRRWASSTTRSSSTSSATTARAWRGRSPARSTS